MSYFLSLLKWCQRVQGCSYSTAVKLEAIKIGEFLECLISLVSTELAMAQFVQTHRGRKALLHEGYKYLKICNGKECTFWRCERLKRHCPARVTTHEGNVRSSRGEHNHPPDLATNKVEIAISNVRKRAREETTTISLIYDEVLQVLGKMTYSCYLIELLWLNFLTVEHRGCYYHYSQAIWRNVQALGLQQEYRSEDGILKSFVQKIAATYFVPPPPPPPAFFE